MRNVCTQANSILTFVLQVTDGQCPGRVPLAALPPGPSLAIRPALVTLFW